MDTERKDKIKKWIENKRTQNKLNMDTILELVEEVEKKAKKETVANILKKLEEMISK